MNDKKDRAENLFGSIGGIGDDLLNEAADFKKNPKKKIVKYSKAFVRGIIIAATLALIMAVTAGILIIGSLKQPKAKEGIKLSGDAFVSDASAELPEELTRINVTADGANTHIISSGSKLILTTSGECDVETLAKYVTVTPTVGMSVTKTASNTFELTPARSGFVPGTVYRVVLGDVDNPVSSFAFQTETKLCIKSMLPADLATEVPVNTGIEITFSDSVKTKNIRDFISIEPSIDYNIDEYPDGKTVAIVPKHKLDNDTFYTVTVKSGIESTAGTKLESGRTVRFRTTDGKSASDSSDPVLSVSDYLYSFYPGVGGTVQYFISGSYRSNKSVVANIYEFPSTDAAAEQLLNRLRSGYDGAEYSKSGLRLIDTVESSVDSYWNGTLALGGNLPCGVYLVECLGNADGKATEKIQFILQVSELASFTESYGSRFLAFVNEYQGGSVGNADITSYSFNYDVARISGKSDVKIITGKTDGNGVYDTEIDVEKYDTVLSVVKSDKGSLIFTSYLKQNRASSYIYDTYLSYFGGYSHESLGFSYIYTDRECYFTTDSVNVFGTVLPRDGQAPEALYLQCGYTSRLMPIDYDRENGYFTASFEFEQLNTHGIQIKIVDADGNVYASKYVQITREEKPVYRASMEFDKLFYKYGEVVNVTLTASFFDGTPAPGLEFMFSSYPFSVSSQTAETDENGQIKFSIKTGITSVYSTDPIDITVTAELVGMETASLLITDSTVYFHSDYCYRVNKDGENIVLKLNRLDTSRLNSESDFLWPDFPENTYGDAAYGEVNYVLRKIEYIKKQVGTEYDKITKKSYPVYKTEQKETVVKNGVFTFANGQIILEALDDSGFHGSYYYDFSYSDGRSTYQNKVWAGKYRQYYDEGIECKLVLSDESYSVGDSVSAYLIGKNGVNTENVLFTLVSGGITDWIVGNGYSFTFEPDHIFSATVYGVYFDGEAYRYAYESPLYNIEKNAVSKLTVTADKAIYKPGETAAVAIKAEGGENGFVIVSVVDEACFAIKEQSIDVSEFFRSYTEAQSLKIDSSIYVGNNNYIKTLDNRMYYSEAKESSDAEDTGATELSAHVREYFANNPTFSVVKLNRDGEGLLTFTVPDNITEWRLSCVAVSGIGSGDVTRVKLAQSVSDVICTQPFFINPAYCNYYIIGDDICVSARSYGTEAAGRKISYTAYLYNEAGQLLDTKTATGMASEYTGFDFGEIENTGTYSVLIEAECGKFTDAVKFSFSVTESGVVTQITKDITPDQIQTLKPLTYPVNLTFYSDKYSLLDSIIRSIRFVGDGSRSDDLVAKYIALSACEKMYGADYSDEIALIKSQISDYTADGKFKLLTYSEGEYELAAKILSVAPELISDSQRESMLTAYNSYLYAKVFSDDTELCAVLLCMASLDAPVLDTLYRVADEAGNYSFEAKLYLAAAFAVIGDYSAASDIYGQIKNEIGVYDEIYGQLKFVGKNADMTVRYTALAMLTSSRISKVDSMSIMRYLLENRSASESNSLEYASFVRFYMPAEKIGDLELVYSVGGQEETVQINTFRRMTLVLTKADLENFKLISIDDGIKITASYGGSISEMGEDNIPSDRVKISKQIKKYSINGMYVVSLTISGTSTRRYESFEITDCIPSGARIVKTVGDGYSFESSDCIRTYACIYNTSGQNMRGYVGIYNNSGDWRKLECRKYSFSITVEYVIRGSVEGNFICENAMITCPRTGEYGFSERYKLKITDGRWVIKQFE